MQDLYRPPYPRERINIVTRVKRGMYSLIGAIGALFDCRAELSLSGAEKLHEERLCDHAGEGRTGS